MRRSWRLNERHYGALQGKNKAQTREELGDEQFMLWRRSYDVPPPPLADDDPYSQAGDPRCALLPPELMPRTECLKDVLTWLMPYSYHSIVPDLAADVTVLVVAPRELAARPGEAPGRHLRRGDRRAEHPDRDPAVYDIGADFRPKEPGGRSLDPQAAAAAAEAVANQGR